MSILSTLTKYLDSQTDTLYNSGIYSRKASMEAVKEITVWADGSTSNHTYLLDGDKMVAYIPFGKTVQTTFKNPIRISKSGRKFEKLKVSPFKQVDSDVNPAIIQVQGSKGETYTVNTEEHTCSCPGFTFRGTCKHIKELV